MTAVVLSLVTAVAFGGVIVSARLALDRTGADPVAGAVVTAASAAVLTATVAVARDPGLAAWTTEGVWAFLVVGAISPGGSHSTFYAAIELAGPSRAGIVSATSPMLAATLAIVFLAEEFSALIALGTAVILAASVLLIYEPSPPEHVRRLGLLLAATTAAFFALRDVVARSVTNDTSSGSAVVATVALVSGMAVLAVVATARLGPNDARRSVRRAFPWFVVPGVFTGLAWITLFEALNHGRVSVVSPLLSTQTVWTVAFGSLVFGRSEATTRIVAAVPLMVLGGILIGVGR